MSPAVQRYVEASRAAQGLPDKVEDEETLIAAARLLSTRSPQTAKRA